MCRSPRPCRIVRHSANSNRALGRRDTTPCSGRKEWGHVGGFPARSFAGADSQPLLAAISAVLRRANEHFDEVVMQRIEELALEAPFELRIVEVARMKVEIVSMHGHGFIFELNDDLDAFALGAR